MHNNNYAHQKIQGSVAIQEDTRRPSKDNSSYKLKLLFVVMTAFALISIYNTSRRGKIFVVFFDQIAESK